MRTYRHDGANSRFSKFCKRDYKTVKQNKKVTKIQIITLQIEIFMTVFKSKYEFIQPVGIKIPKRISQ